MTIFRSRGFDSVISANSVIRGDLDIAPNSVFLIDGQVIATAVKGRELTDGKVAGKTTLHVNGELSADVNGLTVNVQNVIVTGKLSCDVIHVEGTLAVKAGAVLKAKKILYRELIIETGAVVHGQMFHLDHVSEGEQT